MQAAWHVAGTRGQRHTSYSDSSSRLEAQKCMQNSTGITHPAGVACVGAAVSPAGAVSNSNQFVLPKETLARFALELAQHTLEK